MKIKDLILFIHDYQIEWHWFLDQGGKDVVIFVNDIHLSEFREVLSANDYDDEGIDVVLKDNYFCIKMNGLCENNDIDICDVFDLKDNNELIRSVL